MFNPLDRNTSLQPHDPQSPYRDGTKGHHLISERIVTRELQIRGFLGALPSVRWLHTSQDRPFVGPHWRRPPSWSTSRLGQPRTLSLRARPPEPLGQRGLYAQPDQGGSSRPSRLCVGAGQCQQQHKPRPPRPASRSLVPRSAKMTVTRSRRRAVRTR